VYIYYVPQIGEGGDFQSGTGSASISISRLTPGKYDVYAYATVAGQYFSLTLPYQVYAFNVAPTEIFVGEGKVSEQVTVTLDAPEGGYTASLYEFPTEGGDVTLSTDVVYLGENQGTFNMTGDVAGKLSVLVNMNDEPYASRNIDVSVVRVTFDKDVVNPWASGTENAIATITPESAANKIDFDTDNSAIATATPPTASQSPQTVTVQGVANQSGTTYLNAKLNGVVLDSVDVKVKLVRIEINKTAVKSDDITLLSPVQKIKANIILENGTANETLDMTAVPPTAIGVAPRRVTVSSGSPTEVTITPKRVSSSPFDCKLEALDDDLILASETMTIVDVKIPQTIRSSTTPGSYPDRIPPRVPYTVFCTIAPNLSGSGQEVVLKMKAGGNGGKVTINGQESISLTSTNNNLTLLGDPASQTAPGNTSGIRLTALIRGVQALASDAFRLTSIPVNFRQTNVSKRSNGNVIFTYMWDSDSGNVADLSQVWIGEYVTYSDGGIHTGPMPGDPTKMRPWKKDNPDPTIVPKRTVKNGKDGLFGDIHLPPGGLPAPGPADSYTATQYYGFRDLRALGTNVDDTLEWQEPLLEAIQISRYVEIFLSFPMTWEYRFMKGSVTHTVTLGPVQ